MRRPSLHVHPDPASLFAACAARIVELAGSAVAARGAFHWALAGGGTPAGLYALLAQRDWRGRIDWPRVHVWFGDERCVGPEHPDSNYRMAREALLDHVPVVPAQVHRIEGERPPQEAARGYTAALARDLPNGDGTARLDLALLGMGPDGHTASLFPGSDILDRREAGAAAVFLPERGVWRVSLTYPTLEAARHTILLVAGTGKAERVRQVLEEPGADVPVARLHPGGELAWFMDADAAALLRERTP